MTTKKLACAFAGLLAATAFAQAPLGTITSVNGVATVTTGTVGTAVSVGAPIVEGARVITTSTGSVTMRLANGCTVNVPAGHAVTVRSALSCQQLQAAVQPVTTAVTTTTATTAATVPAGTAFGVPTTGVVLGFGALLAIGIIAAENDDDDAPLSGF
jgi:hypothetical protein